MLEKGDMRIIGVVLSLAQDETNAQFLDRISHYAEKNGCKLLVFNSFADFSVDDSPNQPMKSVFRMINFDVLDGIIMFTESLKSPDIISFVTENAEKRDIPVVSLISPAPGAYNIHFDYKENFRAIISHVIEVHGCKRIFFVAGIKDNSFSEERVDCFREEMERHGLEIDERGIGYGNFWADPTYLLMEQWFGDEELEIPEAIICANDSMALAVCIKLEEYGYRVPEDIIVTGHDGIAAERYHFPRLTNAVTDIDAASKRAVELIYEVKGGKDISKDIIIKSKLVISESCGCKKMVETGMNRKISEVYSASEQQVVMNDEFNNMAANLCRMDDFESFLEALAKYVHICWTGRAWICMPESSYTPRHLTGDELSDESTSKQPEADYYEGNEIVNVFKWDYNNGYTPEKIKFNRGDILPDLVETVRDSGSIFFSPIFFRGLPQGYIGLCTGLHNPHMTYASIFMSYLNMTFELVMQKSFNIAVVSQLKYMYIQDFMTGLYNRRGFYTRIRPQLELCMSSKQDLLVISVDMDGLKKINDTYGHNEGDSAIKTLAVMLDNTAGSSAITARFGGDEFVIAKVCPDGEKEAKKFADSLRRKMKSHNDTTEKPYKISASIGSTVTKPESVDSIDRLIEIADDIMYRQKDRHHKQTRG